MRIRGDGRHQKSSLREVFHVSRRASSIHSALKSTFKSADMLWGTLFLVRALGGRIEEVMRGAGPLVGIAGLLLFVITLGSPLLALY